MYENKDVVIELLYFGKDVEADEARGYLYLKNPSTQEQHIAINGYSVNGITNHIAEHTYLHPGTETYVPVEMYLKSDDIVSFPLHQKR